MAAKSAAESEVAQSAAVIATFRESVFAVKILLAGIFVNRIGAFLNIFLVLFLTSKGYSTSQAAFALGIYGVGAMLGVLIGGGLAVRLGARNATVISMASAAALTAALLYLPNYGSLLVAIALASMVAQIYRPASATLLSELTPENRQVMIFAMYRFGMNLGATAAPLIGFGLYHLDHQQYTLLFWGEALIAVGYAFLAQFALPAKKSSQGRDGVAKPTSDGGYLAVLRDSRFSLYLLATFLNAAVYMQYLSTLPLDVHASGLDILWYTVAISLNGFVVIVFELLVTKISQTWPYQLTIGIGMLLIGIGMAFYGLPLGPGIMIIATLIWTTGEVLGAPAAFAYPAVAGPAHLRARYIGSFQFMFGLGSAVGPIIGGALFIQLGHRVWPVIAIGSLFAASLVMVSVRNQPTTAKVVAS